MSELQMMIARKGLLRSGRILAVFVRFADRRLRRRLHGHYRANFYHFLTYKRFYNQTSGHRFRAKNDVQYAFAYSHYVIENDLIKSTVYDGKKFGAYIPVSNFLNAMKNYLQPSFLFPYSQKYLWLCNNAGTSPQDSNYQKIRIQGTGSDSFSRDRYKL